MSYVTYTTNALVCGSFDQNSADRSFLLFTREAGMLYATARSVREERSKQRTALQDFSRVRVSLVKGKQGWRVGSVEAEQNDFSLADSREARGSVVLVYKLLRRFIRGEEASTELYDFTVDALDALGKNAKNRKLLDSFIQIKLLSMLGYVDTGAVPETIKNSTLADIVEAKGQDLLQVMEKIATKATESSHL